MNGTTVAQAIAGVRRRLPPGWVVGEETAARTSAVLTLRAPDGQRADLAVVVRRGLVPRDVPSLVASAVQRAIVVSPYLGSRTRELLAEALNAFYKLREVPGLKKKPSTSELLDWLKLLLAEDVPPEALRTDDPRKSLPPLYGALLKNEQDVHLFEQLIFLQRRQQSRS